MTTSKTIKSTLVSAHFRQFGIYLFIFLEIARQIQSIYVHYLKI